MNGYSLLYVRKISILQVKVNSVISYRQIPYIFYVLFYMYVVFTHIYSPNNGKYIALSKIINIP